MPLFEPLTKEQKEFLPILNNFLAKADTQRLQNIVEMHIRETEKLQTTVDNFRRESQELKASDDKYSREIEKLRAFGEKSNEEHSREIEKLHGTVDKLQDAVHKLQGANEELRVSNEKLQNANEKLQDANAKLLDANTKLQIIPEEAVRKVNGIEKKLNDALENAVENLDNRARAANQELRRRVDQLHVDARVIQDLQNQMRQYGARFVETGSRQQAIEEVMEKLANTIQVPSSSPEELYQDASVQSGYDSRKRHHDNVRDDELHDPHYGEGSKRHARDNYPDHAASRATKSLQQPPRLTRQDAAKAEGSNAQWPTTYEAPTRVKKQPEGGVSSNSDDVSPRLNAIIAHYRAARIEFDASQPKDQRNFIWKFIEGSGDDEFCKWFQERLLEVLPPHKVKRSSKKPRSPGDRLVAISRSLTWDEVRDVVKYIPRALPHFLK